MPGRCILVQGLGYGDEGKGQTIHRLALDHDATMVVRFNGGAQAAHNVIDKDGHHHTFSQFGSASLIPNTRTFLSRFITINPNALMNEAQHLSMVSGRTEKNLFESLAIDRRALVVTPYHKYLNRWKERMRGELKHGSCGMGIGECQADFIKYGDAVLRAGDLADIRTLREKMKFTRYLQLTKAGVLDEPGCYEDIEGISSRYFNIANRLNLVDSDYLNPWLSKDKPVLFEGSQGVLLDEKYGFAPYHTWSNCTFGNAYTLLTEAKFVGTICAIGLLRAYATRHGIGPFVTEDEALTQQIPDKHNTTNDWQGKFRVGHFDLVTARYAIRVIGHLHHLYITCRDRKKDLQVCMGYDDDSSYYACGQLTYEENPPIARQEAMANHLFKVKPGELVPFTCGTPDVLSEELDIEVTII